MSGFDLGAHYYTLTTRPQWFRSKMMILFKNYAENPNQKKKLTVNPNHYSQGLTLISIASAYTLISIFSA